MKKTGLSFVLMLYCSVLWAGHIDVNGTLRQIDTLEHRIIGPGITYTKFNLPDYSIAAYMLIVDLKNQYNSVETFQAKNQIGSTEAMTTAYTRLSTPGHQVLGGVNANFWAVSAQNPPTELLGMPYSGSACQGVMITEPSSWNRGRTTDSILLKQEIGFAVIDEAKKLWICDMQYDGVVSIDNIGSFAISEVNRNRVAPGADEIVLFNEYLGSKNTRTSAEGVEIIVVPTNDNAWSIGHNVTCRVTGKNNAGGTNINAGEAVLSGHGTGKTFLENLNIGDTCTINTSVYCYENGKRPYVSEMITGNALVMRNGELTIRNTNETYNSQTYPRTCIGMSQDSTILYMLVVDPAGTSTANMCGLLKSCGAYNVAGMDGGGSAQMMIAGDIVNNPRDGQERAVSNGWLVYAKAPDDNTVTKLRFEEFDVTAIPTYASYSPKIMAYNQYDVLINDNFQDFTLSCSPANMGTFSADSRTFYAAADTCSGTITATYGSISVTHPVKIINGNIYILLDSLLTDTRNYAIEVKSNTGSQIMDIDPASINWIIQNEEICSINNGVLHGLTNGSTYVYGSLGTFSDSILVKVEIPDQTPLMWDSFTPAEHWTLTCSSGFGAEFAYSDCGESCPTEILFSYQAARGPFLKMEYVAPLYGLPDTVRFSLNTNALFSKIIIGLRPNNVASSGTVGVNFTSIPQNEDVTLSVPMSQLVSNITDAAIYPIWMQYITLNLDASNTAGNYFVKLNGITLCYNGLELTNLNSVSATTLQVYPNPTNSLLHIVRTSENAVQMQLFNLQGKLQKSQLLTDKTTDINISDLSAGTYLLRIGTENIKIVKK